MIQTVVKRDGRIVGFNKEKIAAAIRKAMLTTEQGEDEKLINQIADRIEFRIGDANVEAPRLGIEFDMAFVDGDKRTYRQTYDTLLPIICHGGYIIADNTLWDGHVVDPAYDHDSQTRGIETFNDYIAGDDRVEKVILPIRDGLTIIRKR